MRRNVGCIGLQHQGVQRQLRGQHAQLQRTLERERPAKAQFEAHGDELLGLLQTAIEGMGNAAFHRRLAQTLQQQIGAAPHMQEHGQIVLLRQLQLRFVKQLLPRHVQTGHKTIQTDFTHGHQVRVWAVRVQRLLQYRQVMVLGLRRVQGVDAQGVDIAVLVGELAHQFEVVHLHRWNDTGLNTHCASGLSHRVPVVCKFSGVQVAVAVDPIHSEIVGVYG